MCFACPELRFLLSLRWSVSEQCNSPRHFQHVCHEGQRCSVLASVFSAVLLKRFQTNWKEVTNFSGHVSDLLFWKQKIPISLFQSSVLTYINSHLSEQTINLFFFILSLNKSFGFDLGFLFVLKTHKKFSLISFTVLFPRLLFSSSDCFFQSLSSNKCIFKKKAIKMFLFARSF